MKKTKVMTILCGALLALILFCGVTGCAAKAPKGSWSWEPMTDAGNGGSSTSVMKEEKMDGMTAYNFTGQITNQYEYGYAGFKAYPADDETLEALKTCKTISFKVLGDGAMYALHIPTEDIDDYCYYETVFMTENGKTSTIEINMAALVQPTWGKPASFSQNRAINIDFQTTNNGKPGPFALKVWNLELKK